MLRGIAHSFEAKGGRREGALCVVVVFPRNPPIQDGKSRPLPLTGMQLAISIRNLNILFGKSGNRCAFAGCQRLLTVEGNDLDRIVVLGEAAHIVAESPKGPRGDSPLSVDERNDYHNLVLLCSQHHQLIDAQPQTYTIERLQGMKAQHEQWVKESLGSGNEESELRVAPRVQLEEEIYSTLLPVERVPPFVFGVPLGSGDERSVPGQMLPLRGNEMAPFIIRGGTLYAFQDFAELGNPFEDVVSGLSVERFRVQDWLEDPDTFRWFIDLANRSLNKLTGRRGLHLDKRHRRYYFPTIELGQDREVSYKPLNRNRTSRKVVWQPKSKRTGEGRGYWYHRAVSLRFLNTGSAQWCLSVRPELRVTIDGGEAAAFGEDRCTGHSEEIADVQL